MTNTNDQKDLKSTVTLKGRGYLGTVRNHKEEGKPETFFIEISLLNGVDGNGKPDYLYMSVAVKKSLQNFVAALFEDQQTRGKHIWTTDLLILEVYKPVMKPWSQGGKTGVNITGLLSQITFG